MQYRLLSAGLLAVVCAVAAWRWVAEEPRNAAAESASAAAASEDASLDALTERLVADDSSPAREASPTSTDAADAEPAPAVTPRPPGGVPVYALADDGRTVADLAADLGFRAGPRLEGRASTRALPLGEGHADELPHYAHCDRPDPDAKRLGLVGWLVIQQRVDAYAQLLVEGRVIKQAFFPRDADRVEFRVSRGDLEPYFGGVRARFFGERGRPVRGRFTTHMQVSGPAQAPIEGSSEAHIGGLPSGTYELVAEADGYATWKHTVELAAGEQLDLGRVVLDFARTVAGRVLGPDDQVGDREIELCRVLRKAERCERGERRVTVSDEHGNYVFEDVPAGEWVIRVVNRRHSSKFFGPFGDENGGDEHERVVTPSGWTTGVFSGAIRLYRFDLERKQESRNRLVDTRPGSATGLDLLLEPFAQFLCRSEKRAHAPLPADGVVRGSLQFQQLGYGLEKAPETYPIEVYDELGFRFLAFFVGKGECTIRTFPGSYEVWLREDGVVTRRFPLTVSDGRPPWICER